LSHFEHTKVDKYWEDYAYLEQRTPLAPFSVQAQPLFIKSSDNVEDDSKNLLKNLSRIIHYFGVYYELIRDEKLKPAKNPDGKITFSSHQFKRLFNSCRIPGKSRDVILNSFKTKRDGNCPSTIVVTGKGKIFCFDLLKDEKLLSPQNLLFILTAIYSQINNTEDGQSIPILTCDDRNKWYENREHLKRLSRENENALNLIENAIMIFSFDDAEPKDISELCKNCLDGKPIPIGIKSQT
jgi:carnitine O-octanoyltransferase